MKIINENGKERVFRLRGKQASRRSIGRLVDRVRDAGGAISPAPSLDLRQVAA